MHVLTHHHAPNLNTSKTTSTTSFHFSWSRLYRNYRNGFFQTTGGIFRIFSGPASPARWRNGCGPEHCKPMAATTSPKQRHVEYQGDNGQTVQPVEFFANVISLKQKRLYRGALQASSDNKWEGKNNPKWPCISMYFAASNAKRSGLLAHSLS